MEGIASMSKQALREKDLEVLLDNFVGALDSSRSATVIAKINSNSQWSKDDEQISKIFKPLSELKKQENNQPAPIGLANRTIQKIRDLEKAPKPALDNSRPVPAAFVAQTEKARPAVPASSSTKRYSNIKPSYLALCVCAGFMFIVIPAFMVFSVTGGAGEPGDSQLTSNGSDPIISERALLAENPHSYPEFTFCNDSLTNLTSYHNANNNSIVYPTNRETISDSDQFIPTSGQFVNITDPSLPVQNPQQVKMACPDNYVVLVPQPESEGRPIALIPQDQSPVELNDHFTPVNFNANRVNIIAPVNYQK